MTAPPLHPAEAEFGPRIAAARTRLASRSAFFATLLLHAECVPSWSVARAATEGVRTYLHPEVVATLPTRELDALLLHQVLHAALEHPRRRGQRDARRWNRAADIVVSGLVASTGLPAADRHLALEHQRVEDVYAALERMPDEGVHDSDDLLGDPPQDAPAPGQASGSSLGTQWARIRAMAQTMAALGGGSGQESLGLQRELGGIDAARLDWKAQLWRHLIRTPVDYGGYDRRFIGRRLYLEALDEDALRLAIVVDTSGSIDDAALRIFTTELNAIIGTYPHIRATLYYADVDVHGPYDLRTNAPLPPPQGGGGSDFRGALRTVPDDQDLIVYLTDGYGRFPEHAPRAAVIWVVLAGGAPSDTFPFGEVLRLDPEGPAT